MVKKYKISVQALNSLEETQGFQLVKMEGIALNIVLIIQLISEMKRISFESSKICLGTFGPSSWMAIPNPWWGNGYLTWGSQGLARSLFGQMVPESRSAEFRFWFL